MKWVLKTIQSSIGKKMLMALTGLAFIGFLTIHLRGNLSIYGVDGREAFNYYAEKLHSLGRLVLVSEIGLLLFALIHIGTGLILVFQNYTSRPVKYQLKRSRGGRTISSATMPYTGLVILTFVIIHLCMFTFVEKTESRKIYDIVKEAFEIPLYAYYYFFTMCILGFHIRHGFWSLFQTLGLSHQKYTPALSYLSIALGIGFALGFGAIPLYLFHIVN